MSSLPRTINNPVQKDTVTFIKTTEETLGEYVLAEMEVMAGGGNPLHYHCTFTETFAVVKGRLDVDLHDQHLVLQPGDSATVPLRTHHRFYNLSDKPTTCTLEIRPARTFEQALRVVYGLASDGKTNARGIPTNIWHLALLFELAESYVPGLPLMLQQALFGSLANIARRRRRDKDFDKYLV